MFAYWRHSISWWHDQLSAAIYQHTLDAGRHPDDKTYCYVENMILAKRKCFIVNDKLNCFKNWTRSADDLISCLQPFINIPSAAGRHSDEKTYCYVENMILAKRKCFIVNDKLNCFKNWTQIREPPSLSHRKQLTVYYNLRFYNHSNLISDLVIRSN